MRSEPSGRASQSIAARLRSERVRIVGKREEEHRFVRVLEDVREVDLVRRRAIAPGRGDRSCRRTRRSPCRRSRPKDWPLPPSSNTISERIHASLPKLGQDPKAVLPADGSCRDNHDAGSGLAGSTSGRRPGLAARRAVGRNTRAGSLSKPTSRRSASPAAWSRAAASARGLTRLAPARSSVALIAGTAPARAAACGGPPCALSGYASTTTPRARRRCRAGTPARTRRRSRR